MAQNTEDNDVRVEVRIYNSKGKFLSYNSPLTAESEESVAERMKTVILCGRDTLAAVKKKTEG